MSHFDEIPCTFLIAGLGQHCALFAHQLCTGGKASRLTNCRLVMHIARAFETSQLATRWFLSDITHGFTLRFHIHNSRIQDNCPFSCALFKAQVCFSFRVDASDGKCVFHSKRQVGHNESCFLRSHLRSIWAGLGRSETAFYRDFPGIDDLRAPFKLSRKTKSQLEEDGILGGDWEEYMITACFISFFFVMFSIISLHLLGERRRAFPPLSSLIAAKRWMMSGLGSSAAACVFLHFPFTYKPSHA